jgi:hypothetical protein
MFMEFFNEIGTLPSQESKNVLSLFDHVSNPIKDQLILKYTMSANLLTSFTLYFANSKHQ